jgi:hypothetical protein
MFYSRAVGQAVFNADSTLAASKPRSLETVLGESIAHQRMQAILITVFASVALFLGVIGLSKRWRCGRRTVGNPL